VTARPLALLLVVPLLAAACHGKRAEEVETEAAVAVEVAHPRQGTLTAVIHATGTVEAAPGADWTVTAPASAKVAAVHGAPGDHLRKGTLVVRFEAPSLKADLATRSGDLSQAQARLENARRNHARLSELLEKGIASRKEVEDAHKDLLDAEAALRQATGTKEAAAELAAQATAEAPFDGTVVQRWHNPGDLVDANEHVLRLVDLRRLQVTAAIPVADATRVIVGRPARVTVPGSKEGVELAAKVASGPAIVDSATGTTSVRLSLSATLPVETPVEVAIDAEEKTNAVIVPATAVLREEDKTTVFVVDATQHVHKRPVVVGLASGDEVEIVSGLQPTDTVVVKGMEDLPDGALVTVEKE
jgi:membrane fusion protein, heavy metal efflux system